jgi:hypothetical protein
VCNKSLTATYQCTTSKWQVTNYLSRITNEPIGIIILITSWLRSKLLFPPFRLNEYHYFRMPLPLALSISGIVRVPFMFLIKWTNLFQSSLSGARTLVVRNVIAVQVSGLARLVEYNVFAIRLWNSTALSCLSFSQLSSTFKRLSGAALVLVPTPFGSALSKAVRISSM